MAEWKIAEQNVIDYTPNGETLGGFAEKTIATFAQIFGYLNKLRASGAMPGLDDTDAEAFEIRIDTSTGTIYIRNSANTEWIELGSVERYFGLDAEKIGAIKNGGGLGSIGIGKETNLPTAGNNTYDFYFAWDTARLYYFTGSAWHIYLSRQFKDMLDYESYCVSKEEVQKSTDTDIKGKIPRLNAETGDGDFDISGSAKKLLGYAIEVPIKMDADGNAIKDDDGNVIVDLKDGAVLEFDSTKGKFVPKQNTSKDTITTADVTYSGEAGKVVAINSEDGLAHIDIKGSALRFNGIAMDKTNIADTFVMAYDAASNKFVFVPKDHFTEDDVTATGEAGKLVKTNEDGKLTADITGSPDKIAGIPLAVNDIEDGQVLVYHSSTNTIRNEAKGVVGEGKSLILKNGSTVISDYNGSTTTTVDVGNILERITASSLKHVERLIADLYLSLEAQHIYPDGYDGMMVETFDDGGTEVDQTSVFVSSVVSGDDSIDVDFADSLLIGSVYQLTDGISTEEVRIKSINVAGSVNRVILEKNVQKQYVTGTARLYRSSVVVSDGKAYGGGGIAEYQWEADTTFVGEDTEVAQTVSLAFNSGTAGGFDTTGNIVNDDNSMSLYSFAIGIALIEPGGGAGVWARVDSKGNDIEAA